MGRERRTVVVAVPSDSQLSRAPSDQSADFPPILQTATDTTQRIGRDLRGDGVEDGGQHEAGENDDGELIEGLSRGQDGTARC